MAESTVTSIDLAQTEAHLDRLIAKAQHLENCFATLQVWPFNWNLAIKAART